MNCGAPLMEHRFQIPKIKFEVQKATFLFCLVQNGPGVSWVACKGLRERFKWSLGCTRSFLGFFMTFCNTCNTQSQQAARIEFQKNDIKEILMLKIIMAPDGPLILNFFLLHILTD